MLKIERQTKSFLRLDEPTLAGASITERYDLQEFIVNSPKQFFAEIGQELFVLGKEVKPSETVPDRIDILAIDQEGRAVVIELKRGNDRLQLLQAISYAGMLSKWQPADFLRLLDEERRKELTEKFLQVEEEEDINREQRIILVAEAYDYEALVGAEWLSEKYGVDIICCRILLAKDPQHGVEYLTCTQILPAPELAHQAIPRGAGAGRVQRWTDWDTALSAVENPAIVQYFNRELQSGRECYLPKRILRYRIKGKRRFSLMARSTTSAYVWQEGRFHEDIEFWRGGISNPESVQPVKESACLRFLLATEKDLVFFHSAVTRDLTTVEWEEPSSEASVSDEPQSGSETTDETRK
jgi:hypothetical protein